MSSEMPLLKTKLFAPVWRDNMVARPRLHGRIAQGPDGRLTFVSAPAGFGKTTLVGEWVANMPHTRVGWVSLDPADNDPVIFWSYVFAALATVSPDLGGRSRTLLESPQPPAIAAVLTPLINELAAIEQPLVLVLDDYHVIDAPAVHEGIGFLIDHMPPALHLVLVSRTEPPLSLARLRARRQLVEIKSPDLRFTSDEATAFLVHVMGLELSSTEVASLEERTEGWIAGLQLAALSLQNRADVGGFMVRLSGDNRHISDYLVEEVLQGQPELLRSFLLDTSILDRLTGPLCDAVTGRKDGTELLGQLEMRSLFILPLDDRREWYRYHHLFADVLRTRSAVEDSARARTLHRRASEWHHANGTPREAVHHALAAKDPAWAAMLIELAWPTMDRRHQSATWLGWVRELPDEILLVRPVLSLAYAWALLNASEFHAGEARLRDVERWLATADTAASPTDVVVADHEQLRSLPVSLATARAYLAQAHGDVPNTVQHAREVLDLLPEEDYLARAPAAALLGLAYWADGQLEAAYRTFAGSMAWLEKGGDFQSAIGGSRILADIMVAQGRLNAAAALYDSLLARAAAQSTPVFPGVEELHLGMSEVYRERNDLGSAEQHLTAARDLVEVADWPRTGYRWCTTMARVTEARGDAEGARRLLDEAERLQVRGPVPELRPIRARIARNLITQGKLEEAFAWARNEGVDADNGLEYSREFEHLTLARLLIAQGVVDRLKPLLVNAIALLGHLLEAAQKDGRTGSEIEILMVQALAQNAYGDGPPALKSLELALALAEPEGYVRLFVDEGTPMRDLLNRAATSGIGGLYRRRLLSAFNSPAPRAASAGPGSGLVRPLTTREVEIVRLVAAGLRNQEIADQLFISPSTVKRHIANAYEKLGVRHRVAAVARANELSLL